MSNIDFQPNEGKDQVSAGELDSSLKNPSEGVGGLTGEGFFGEFWRALRVNKWFQGTLWFMLVLYVCLLFRISTRAWASLNSLLAFIVTVVFILTIFLFIWTSFWVGGMLRNKALTGKSFGGKVRDIIISLRIRDRILLVIILPCWVFILGVLLWGGFQLIGFFNGW